MQLGGLPEDVVIGGGEGVALPVEREVGVVGVCDGQGVDRPVAQCQGRGRGRGVGPGDRVHIGHIALQVKCHFEVKLQRARDDPGDQYLTQKVVESINFTSEETQFLWYMSKTRVLVFRLKMFKMGKWVLNR